MSFISAFSRPRLVMFDLDCDTGGGAALGGGGGGIGGDAPLGDGVAGTVGGQAAHIACGGSPGSDSSSTKDGQLGDNCKIPDGANIGVNGGGGGGGGRGGNVIYVGDGSGPPQFFDYISIDGGTGGAGGWPGGGGGGGGSGHATIQFGAPVAIGGSGGNGSVGCVLIEWW